MSLSHSEPSQAGPSAKKKKITRTLKNMFKKCRYLTLCKMEGLTGVSTNSPGRCPRVGEDEARQGKTQTRAAGLLSHSGSECRVRGRLVRQKQISVLSKGALWVNGTLEWWNQESLGENPVQYFS